MTDCDTGFLQRAGWADAVREDLPSDASERRYARLSRQVGSPQSAILMMTPATEEARRQMARFRSVASWLRGLGLAAPAEYAADPRSGLLLLEDLGRRSLAGLVEGGDAAAHEGYVGAVSVLARIAAAPPPRFFEQPVLAELLDMMDLTFELITDGREIRERLRATLASELGRNGTHAASLRDVHGDNLIWRAEEDGVRRIGLLDFQDALCLPDGYDLASLLDDPRRDVPMEWRMPLIARYAALRDTEADVLLRRVDALSVLRNVRILGIFHRLGQEKGRRGYARFIPRTQALLTRAAKNPALSGLRPAVDDLVAATRRWPDLAA